MDIGWLPLGAFILTALGWLSRELWRWRKARRQAAYDSSQTLKDKKTLLEEVISKTEDTKRKDDLNNQLEEVNAALLGLYSERLYHTLKEAGLPTEEMLIADGQRGLQPEQARRFSEDIEEVTLLSRPVLTRSILLMLGNAYYYADQYQDAKDIYDKILKVSPDDPIALNNRGAAYQLLGRHDESLADYNRSLEMRPDHPDILIGRGTTLSKLQRYEEALSDLNRSIRLRPDDPNTLNNRGNTYDDLGRYDEALADYNRSLELRPDDPGTFYNIACLFSLWGKTDDALDYLEKAIALDKKSREMAKTDKDFDNIREDPRFKKLIEPD